MTNCPQTRGSSQRIFTSRQGESSSSSIIPYCQLCRRPHLGECLKFKGVGVCYNCVQGGHLKRNCPMLLQEGGMSQRVFPQQSVGSTRPRQGQGDALASRAGASSGVQSNIASGKGTQSKGQAGRPKKQVKVFARHNKQQKSNWMLLWVCYLFLIKLLAF